MADNNQTPPATPPVPPATPTATPDEIAVAQKKGKTVRVEMPSNIEGVTHEGVSYVAEEEGNIFLMYIKHALHAVEAFGGRILSEIEPKKPKK